MALQSVPLRKPGKQGFRVCVWRMNPRSKNEYESGLSIERIHTDLKLNHDYKGSYHSVYRFVKSLDDSASKRVHRMECEPGQEAQINEAARKANIHGQYTLKELHLWLCNSHDQEIFSFLEQHELIRNPQSYDSIAATSELFN